MRGHEGLQHQSGKGWSKLRPAPLQINGNLNESRWLAGEARPDIDVLHLETSFVSENSSEGSVHPCGWKLHSSKEAGDVALEVSAMRRSEKGMKRMGGRGI